MPARIVLALGDRFPMIGAHKVLAAYGCLVPRAGDRPVRPDAPRAIWPSTGNYCRGGVAISRILGCRGVAVLPEGMSRERFDWLDRWVADPADIVRTPGSESNVKEIYDACAALDRDPAEHRLQPVLRVRQLPRPPRRAPAPRWSASSAPSPQAGRAPGSPPSSRPPARRARSPPATISKQRSARRSSRSRRANARRCSTTAIGEHNIQGIGDKHVPLIHNVMNTDVVVGVSDRATDTLSCCSTPRAAALSGRAPRRRAGPGRALGDFGLSSICNIVAAIKTRQVSRPRARGRHSSPSRPTVPRCTAASAPRLVRYFGKGFDAVSAGETCGRSLAGASTDHRARTDPHRSQARLQPRLLHLGRAAGRVARGFRARCASSPSGTGCSMAPAWDAMIAEFNARSGAAASCRDWRRGERFRCHGCGATVDPARVLPFRCPNAAGRRRRRSCAGRAPTEARLPERDERNPFLRYRRCCRRTVWPVPPACPTTPGARWSENLTRRWRRRRARLPHHAHVEQPALAAALGLATTLWVKDETRNVSGSHKARHLMGVMLYLRVLEVAGLPAGPGCARGVSRSPPAATRRSPRR